MDYGRNSISSINEFYSIMSKTLTLLEQAKEVDVKIRVKVEWTEEETDVLLAWLKSEITYKQVVAVLSIGKTHTNYMYTMATGIREAYRRGKIKVV